MVIKQPKLVEYNILQKKDQISQSRMKRPESAQIFEFDFPKKVKKQALITKKQQTMISR